MLRCFWLCLLWLACACAFAGVPEKPRFRVVGPAQGLPSTEVKTLVRDQDGYLWIGTSDGLARYDGVEMRVWRHDPQRQEGLPGNNIQALLVDSANRLWVAVEGQGISILNATRAHFTHINMGNQPLLASDDIWAFARQGDTVWFGTYDGGLYQMRRNGQMTRYSAEKNGLPSNTVLALAVDAEGALWVGTEAGLARQHKDGFITQVLPDLEEQPLVYSLSEQRDGLWVGTAAGVWQRVGQHWQQPAWSPMFQRPNAMMAIASDAQDGHWLASQRGLWVQRGDAAPVPVKTAAGADIPRVVLTLLMQEDGALWAPVIGAGLGYLHSSWRQMARFKNEQDGLQGTLYRAIAPARGGGFWLGGFNGMVEHLRADGEIQTLSERDLAKLRGTKLLSIADDDLGNLWLGHRVGLLQLRADGQMQQWGKQDADNPAPAGQVDQLVAASDGTLWLSAPGGGVQQRDQRSGKVLRNFPANDSSGLGVADIEAMVLSPRNEVFLATDTGVLTLNQDGDHFQRIKAVPQDRVYALAFDGADLLWVQRQLGLFAYQRQAGQWREIAHVGSQAGIPALGAAGLEVDNQHRVWMSTIRGLYRWDPATRGLRRYGMQDGDASEEYLDRAFARSAQGVLALAAADGSLLLVDTTLENPKPMRPVLQLDRIAVRRGGRWQEQQKTAQLTFAYKDKEFRFGTRLLAFDDPRLNRYWAKLDGFDRSWVALGADGDRVLTGLSPGHYVLRFRAQDGAGNVAQEQVLAFTVLPPWWWSFWAKMLYAVLLVSVVITLALFYRARLRRLHAWQLAEHKRELAEQASEAKSRFLATLGHEVRTPMTGVLGMAELLQTTPLDDQQHHYVESIRRAGHHLLRLVNDALDLARIEAGKLELASAPFSIHTLLSDVASLMAPVAERKGLVFVEHMDADLAHGLVGDATRVQQILLNLIGNAVKFTDNGYVALETYALKPHGVQFVVLDTGPGLSEEQQKRVFRRFEQAEGMRTTARYGGSGLGLAISQELAAAMGGRIYVNSELSKGTRFVVELPLQAAELRKENERQPSEKLRDGFSQAQTLLLVEDDTIVAQAMTGLLQEQGHRVIHVTHAMGALTEITVQPFDAALLDLDLPGMDGLSLARMLRQQNIQIPLLAVTARSDMQAEQQAKEAGFDGFLRKPLTGAMLAQALQSLHGS